MIIDRERFFFFFESTNNHSYNIFTSERELVKKIVKFDSVSQLKY